ncbi:MAG: phosphotransferase [Chloroflexota bacterium]
MSNSLTEPIKQRLNRLLGQPVTAQEKVVGGYTPAARWRIHTNAGSYFAKIGSTPLTTSLLRREARAYEAIEGSFMPQFFGWDDDEAAPLLVIEDLSTAHWPPPWDRKMVDAVLAQLEVLHNTVANVPTLAEIWGEQPDKDWLKVAQDPEPFLGLGLVDGDWLETHLPLLLEMEEKCEEAGTAVTHGDIRSDNLCITASGVKLIDWPEACLSNPRLDLGFWLPSLAYESDILPETILSNAPEVAARVAGYFAARAGLPVILDAPFVRRVQRQQLNTALPWAIRALNLPAK